MDALPTRSILWSPSRVTCLKELSVTYKLDYTVRSPPGTHWKCWVKPVPPSIPQQGDLADACSPPWKVTIKPSFASCPASNFLSVGVSPPTLWQVSFSDNLWCGTSSKAFAKLDGTVSARLTLHLYWHALRTVVRWWGRVSLCRNCAALFPTDYVYPCLQWLYFFRLYCH